MVKTILIVGGSGFVGGSLALRLREGYRVFTTHNKHPVQIRGVTSLLCPVENRNWVKRILYGIEPYFIIYAAGNASTGWCEAHTREAELMHNSGAGNFLSQTDSRLAKFIYLSNPYTFDGMRGNYREGDNVLPQNQMGKVKLGGENYVRSKAIWYSIIRSSPLFGRSTGSNLSFLDQLRIRMNRGEKIELSADETHSFAPAEGFLDAIERVIESAPKNKIFHYGGLTKMTYYDFGVEFARYFGFDEKLLIAKRSVSRRKSTKTEQEEPYDFSLNSSAIANTLQVKPMHLQDGFERLRVRGLFR